jgi:hypothetical protein
VYAVGLSTSKKLAPMHPLQPAIEHKTEKRSGPLVRFRTTLVCSGQTTLRTRGLFERYRTLLDPLVRDQILNVVPGGWLPVDVAMGHLAACEALGMTEDDAFESGVEAGQRVNGVVLDTLARLAAGAGASPWTVLGVYDRMLRRVFDGGAFTIETLGPREARVEMWDMPPFGFAYFRHAYRGALYGAMCRFSETLRVEEISVAAHATGFAMRLSWT